MTRASLLALVVVALVACRPRPPAGVERLPDEPRTAAALADEDLYVPAYGKPELHRATSTERIAVAAALRTITDETDPSVRANLAVRRRFVAALEACEATGRYCPPRLDEPAEVFDPEGESPPRLDAPLRFDVDSWRAVAAELFARACACRTIACIDGAVFAIAALETRPTPEVQRDDAATLSVTRARECLSRLRGRTTTHMPR